MGMQLTGDSFTGRQKSRGELTLWEKAEEIVIIVENPDISVENALRREKGKVQT